MTKPASLKLNYLRLGILVGGCVSLFAGAQLALAVLGNPRHRKQDDGKRHCIANLKQIDSAKEQWAMDNNKRDGDTPAEKELVGARLYLKTRLTCPNHGSYDIDAVGKPPACSIHGPLPNP